MQELIQWYIDIGSTSGEAAFGMVCAALIVLGMGMVFIYQISDLFIEWFKRIKPIKINKVQKIDKIVEVPKYVENDYNKEVLGKLKVLEKEIKSLKEGDVKL